METNETFIMYRAKEHAVLQLQGTNQIPQSLNKFECIKIGYKAFNGMIL